jgi:nicotinate dehydrogenase subunit A
MATYNLRINGFPRGAESSDPEKPLLYVLRDFGLTAAKYGCGLGQCGACTVLVDGNAVRSCQIPISDAAGKTVTTLEGLEGNHPVQAAFIAEQVPQCGYCTNGMIMSSVALLSQKKNPNDAEIVAALEGNLCRCGTQTRVLAAVKRVALGG